MFYFIQKKYSIFKIIYIKFLCALHFLCIFTWLYLVVRILFFVVIDAFRTDRPLKPMMKKIYRRFCVEFGYANLAVISNFKHYLTEKGFVDVLCKNITKNIRRSVIQWSIISAPYFIKKNIMGMIPFVKKNKSGSQRFL